MFFFGSGNLADDAYLRSLMDSDGWVSLEKIMTFPRMKKHKLVIHEAAFAALIIQTFPLARCFVAQFRGNTKVNLAVSCSVYCRWRKCYVTRTQLGARYRAVSFSSAVTSTFCDPSSFSSQVSLFHIIVRHRQQG